jgi:succinate-acetate transporter protein
MTTDAMRRQQMSRGREAERTEAERSEVERVKEETPARVYLQPIAAPSILGLFGFAGATFVVAANLAGWYGNSTTPDFLFPFAAFFGGLAQFLAGMWAFRARDGLATAMHGMWGSFWMAYGVLWLLIAAGTITAPTGAFPALGFWFIALAWITWVGAYAARAVSGALVGVLGFLAAGATVMAAGQISGAAVATQIAGYLFIISAILAWYTASGLMLESTFGREVLPLGVAKEAKARAHINIGIGEPGVKHGQ